MKQHAWESRETMTPEKAIQFLKEGNLRFIKTTEVNRTSSNDEFVYNVTKLNVLHQIEEIFSHSSLLREMITNKEIGVVGATYDVSNGKVTFSKGFIPFFRYSIDFIYKATRIKKQTKF